MRSEWETTAEYPYFPSALVDGWEARGMGAAWCGERVGLGAPGLRERNGICKDRASVSSPNVFREPVMCEAVGCTVQNTGWKGLL